MKENTVVAFQNPSDFQKDPLTEVLQAGARELLAQAVEAEVSVFLGSHAALVDAAGRRRVVRNGYLSERFIQTGIGPVSVRQPRVRDRGDGAIRFTSAILPRYLRRAKSLEDLLPWLYLKGISTGDFGEALAALSLPFISSAVETLEFYIPTGYLFRHAQDHQHAHLRLPRNRPWPRSASHRNPCPATAGSCPETEKAPAIASEGG